MVWEMVIIEKGELCCGKSEILKCWGIVGNCKNAWYWYCDIEWNFGWEVEYGGWDI